jgi:hypothetical protein
MLDLTSGGSRGSKPAKSNPQQSNGNPTTIENTIKGKASKSRTKSMMVDTIVARSALMMSEDLQL